MPVGCLWAPLGCLWSACDVHLSQTCSPFSLSWCQINKLIHLLRISWLPISWRSQVEAVQRAARDQLACKEFPPLCLERLSDIEYGNVLSVPLLHKVWLDFADFITLYSTIVAQRALNLATEPVHPVFSNDQAQHVPDHCRTIRTAA